MIEVPTPLGPARVHRHDPGQPRGTLLLGHGAGAGSGSADLLAVAGAACGAGWRVLRIDQPWVVAGRRIAPAPARLDEGWTAVVGHLRAAGELTGPVVFGGRSAGARVACRTAGPLEAAGVLALAFPLHPPGRPEKSRAEELTAVAAPLLVVQGATDAFGRPAEVEAVLPGRVVAVPGDHGLTKDPGAVATAAVAWLRQF